MNNIFICELISDLTKLTDNKNLVWNAVNGDPNSFSVKIQCNREHTPTEIDITIGSIKNPEVLYQSLYFTMKYGDKNIHGNLDKTLQITTLHGDMEITKLIAGLYNTVYIINKDKMVSEPDKKFLLGMVKQIKTSHN